MQRQINKTDLLANRRPDLIREWDCGKNGELTPYNTSYGSHKKVWWKCTKCNHEWHAIIKNRSLHNQGCPRCVNQFIDKTNCLLTVNPELCKDWNYKKNSAGPENFSPHSRKKVWWVCSKCKFEWLATINSRSSGCGCGSCSGRFASDVNNLLVIRPEVCEDWSYKKNELGPECYTPCSEKIVWWKCSKCGFEYEAQIANKTKSGTCKRCIGKIIDETNRLIITNSELCKEWNYKKNDLGPENYTVHGHKKVWWVCSKCDFEWEARVYRRAKEGTGCPRCAGQFVDNTNSLLTLNPGLCKEWNYEKNELGPGSFTAHSGKVVWWKCSVCDKEWKSIINNRSKGQGCPSCAHRFSKKCSAWIDGFNNPNIEKGGGHTVEGRNFEFDGFDKTTNTIYEFYGDYWHGNPRVYDPDDKIFYGKTFGELYEKTLKREEFLISCGYSLVTIWEDTWDKAVKRSKNDINQLQQQGMPEAI